MTATPRAFRFGVLSPAADAASWLRDAREAEARGYSTLVLTDHLDLSGAHVTRLAWVPALAAAAAVTTRLRFTVMVANQDLRHPAVLARDVAAEIHFRRNKFRTRTLAAEFRVGRVALMAVRETEMQSRFRRAI